MFSQPGDYLVEIFCDANEKIGIGHIKRSSALAAYLRKRNIPVRLTGLSEFAKNILPVSENVSQKAGVVVFDSHEGIDSKITAAQKNGQITVTLDWFGTSVPDINIAVYPHQQVHALRKAYIGFEYIIIRDEVRRIQKNPDTELFKKVLVCLGGGDLLGQGYDTAVFLNDKGFDVTLVQGPLAKQKPDKKDFDILVNPPNFPQILANCDWAVTNGGGCLFEALYLGRPTIVLPQTDMEKRIVDYVQQHDSLLGIGLESLREFKTEELKRVSENGKKIIDGKGLHRIAAIIKEQL